MQNKLTQKSETNPLRCQYIMILCIILKIKKNYSMIDILLLQTVIEHNVFYYCNNELYFSLMNNIGEI